MLHLKNAPLGKASNYRSSYDPSLLFAISRSHHRKELGLGDTCPFYGCDIWNAYEISWLNLKGKPEVAIGEFYVPATSPNIFESKSFKLYLNSLSNTKYKNSAEVEAILTHDLSECVGGEVIVKLYSVDRFREIKITNFKSTCLDDLDIDCIEYQPNKELLIAAAEKKQVTESIHSNLLKSNCLVTSQPDWASVNISYTGQKISHESLLKYIVSFRNHNEFHESCAERIFMDIYTKFKPEKLTVYARYTRRGGLDINPIRSTDSISLEELVKSNIRQPRQ
ncbi:MAG: NADPH-dependent 7-cyano-7-deazaguanine reductase QueF [Gammaproteobacteria bacterium]|nr:NADPH-dependent 7-cyano-7-deazaguanine reductase QueF [Gammaproteobacteria bacterium]